MSFTFCPYLLWSTVYIPYMHGPWWLTGVSIRQKYPLFCLPSLTLAHPWKRGKKKRKENGVSNNNHLSTKLKKVWLFDKKMVQFVIDVTLPFKTRLLLLFLSRKLSAFFDLYFLYTNKNMYRFICIYSWQ